MILAPIFSNKKGSHEQLLAKLTKDGFVKVLLNGKIYEIEDIPPLDPKLKNSLSAVIDRLTIKDDNRQRLLSSVESATTLANGSFEIAYLNDNLEIERTVQICIDQICSECGFSAPKLEPRDFSFNSPKGLCLQCDGLGNEYQIDKNKITFQELTLSQGALWGFDKTHPYYHSILTLVCAKYGIPMDVPFSHLPTEQRKLLLSPELEDQITITKPRSRFNRFSKKITWTGVLNILNTRYKNTEQEHVKEQLKSVAQYLPCSSCKGSRLNKTASNVKVHNWTITKLTQLSISKTKTVLDDMTFTEHETEIATQIIQEIRQRLGFLCDVGLDYLTLARSADTLSGGESQRIRLASQIGSQLVGVMYVLDEPSIGLHQRDNGRLLKTLKKLVNLGNSVIVVEHDLEAITQADYIIDIGPGAGKHGGQIIAVGTSEDISQCPSSVTGDYIVGRKTISPPLPLLTDSGEFIEVIGAYMNNLKHVSVKIPIGLLTCVTGVSGSGKSTLLSIKYSILTVPINLIERILIKTYV